MESEVERVREREGLRRGGEVERKVRAEGGGESGRERDPKQVKQLTRAGQMILLCKIRN